jgi:hypothetical protein
MKCTLRPAVLLVSAALGGCTVTVDSHTQIVREEKRFPVTGQADLRLTTFDGSIQIQSWDKPEIVVEVEKRGGTRDSVETLEVKSDQKGNAIELEVKRPRSETFNGIGIYRTATARLIVMVPRTTNIRARSGDGAITVEGITGKLDVHTGDGSIRARDVVGDLTLSTADGSVTVEDAEGRLDLNTGDGGVTVGGKLTAVRVHTGDGSVVYRAEPGTAMGEAWDITTGDGSVTVYLPREFSAELDAYTGDGGIRNDLDDASLERDERTGSDSRRSDKARRSFRGRVGQGGHELRIRSGDGPIRLRVS